MKYRGVYFSFCWIWFWKRGGGKNMSLKTNIHPWWNNLDPDPYFSSADPGYESGSASKLNGSQALLGSLIKCWKKTIQYDQDPIKKFMFAPFKLYFYLFIGEKGGLYFVCIKGTIFTSEGTWDSIAVLYSLNQYSTVQYNAVYYINHSFLGIPTSSLLNSRRM